MLPRISGFRSPCLPPGLYTEENAWPIREGLISIALNRAVIDTWFIRNVFGLQLESKMPVQPVTHPHVQPLGRLGVANPTLSVSRELLEVTGARVVDRLHVPFVVAPVQLRRTNMPGQSSEIGGWDNANQRSLGAFPCFRVDCDPYAITSVLVLELEVRIGIVVADLSAESAPEARQVIECMCQSNLEARDRAGVSAYLCGLNVAFDQVAIKITRLGLGNSLNTTVEFFPLDQPGDHRGFIGIPLQAQINVVRQDGLQVGVASCTDPIDCLRQR